MKKKVYVVFKNYIDCNMYKDANWVKENGLPVTMPLENYPISRKRCVEIYFHKENINMEKFSKATDLSRHARYETDEGITFMYNGYYHSIKQISVPVKKVEGVYFAKIDDCFVHISDSPKMQKQKDLGRNK